jgi:3-methyladenine DNA glycosylase/8-oxoguanine DNA glycosylase
VSSRSFPLPERYDLGRSVGRLAVIPRDPTVLAGGREAWWATLTPAGPGTLLLRVAGGSLTATAYGPGASWLLDRADSIAGLRDDVSGFDASGHEVVRRLWRAFFGVRLPATGRVFHHVVAAILGQKVTGKEAAHGYRRLLRHFAASAGPVPGPPGLPARLMLPPDPEAVAATPYWAFHPWGIEQKRADTVRRAAAFAARLDASPDAATATRLLRSVPGIGVWTAAEVMRVAYGDGDAVSVGDYHHKNTVAWALAGEPRGTDERMLELLEPFRGHRGRVVTLLELGGIGAPRFGPRMPIRSFARF